MKNAAAFKELFRISVCIESPKGVVVAGASADLDAMPHEGLQSLLSALKSVSIVGKEERLEDVKVKGFQVTTAISNRRNVFLLLGKEVSEEAIPVDGVLYYAEN